MRLSLAHHFAQFLVALLVVNVAEVILLLIGLALRDNAPDPESIFPIAPLGILFLNLRECPPYAATLGRC